MEHITRERKRGREKIMSNIVSKFDAARDVCKYVLRVTFFFCCGRIRCVGGWGRVRLDGSRRKTGRHNPQETKRFLSLLSIGSDGYPPVESIRIPNSQDKCGRSSRTEYLIYNEYIVIRNNPIRV
ncbi:hypothetical protein Zmor_026067 [Zophobas morio]|uniref:Uncharacterized protein n=1 Tax=Zophobas morio TaxID=2755281 RepID=A0AA38HY80_9CUCU|nr:hypothetical protein Zmor_026067 [Zophobas morio]